MVLIEDNRFWDGFWNDVIVFHGGQVIGKCFFVIKQNSPHSSDVGIRQAKLGKISPTPYVGRTGKPYYKGLMYLVRNHLGHDPARNIILPGMTVDPD